MEKVLAQGEAGSVKVVQENAELKLKAEFGASLGGVASGALKAQAGFEIALEEIAVIDLAVAVLEAKFPALAIALEPAKAYAEAALKKA